MQREIRESDSLQEQREIASLSVGEQLEGAVFLAAKLELRETRKGASYLCVELRDQSGVISARLWNNVPATLDALRNAPAVRVGGLVEEWRRERQLKLESIEAASPSPSELQGLIPRTPFNLETLLERLETSFESLSNPWLRELLLGLLEDREFVLKLRAAPAAARYHHSYMGGLLEHIVSLVELAEKVVVAYPRLNRDLVIAGCFLHDIGKIDEIAWDKGFKYTTRGQLLGHIAIGSIWIEQWAAKIEGFPAQLKDELIHLVLSHHGLREHGSPVIPATPEAIVVHFLDNMDGKLWSAFRAIDEPSAEGDWSGYSPHLGRRLYRSGQDSTSPARPSASPVEGVEAL